MTSFFRRYLSLFDLAASNLIRRPARTLVVLVPLVTALAVASAMTLVRDGFLLDATSAVGVMPDVTVQRMVGGRVERIPISYAEEIARIEGVECVTPRVWGYVPVSLGGEAGEVAYTLMGIDLSRIEVPEEMGGVIEEGRFLSPSGRGEAVVGKVLADGLGLAAGDRFVLSDEFGNADTFHVVGVFSTPVQIYAADLVVTGLEDARRYFGYFPEEASDLLIYTIDPLLADRVAARILEIDPSLRVLTRDLLVDLTRQAYGGRSGVFSLLWIILLFTALLVAFAQAANLHLDLVREVGILKALGWSSGEVIALRTFESLLVGLFSVLLGYLVGLGYVVLGAPGMRAYFLGWSVVYPDFELPVVVEPASLFLLAAVGVFPLLAATVVPAWLVGTFPPDEAIRR